MSFLCKSNFLTDQSNQLYYWGKIEDAQKIHQIKTEGIWREGLKTGLWDKKIKFSRVHGTAIGHIGLIDFAVKYEILQKSNPKNLVIIRDYSCKNPSLLNYWSSYCQIVSADQVEGVMPYVRANEIYFEGWIDKKTEKYCKNYKWQVYAAVQKEWERQKRPSLLKITKEDQNFGDAYLKEHKLQNKFITIHVKETGPEHSTGRFSSLEKLIPIISWLENEKVTVVIIGEKKETELPFKNLFYYNNRHKDERLDLFFLASAKLFIGNTSGPASISPCFGIPCFLFDWHPPGYIQPYKCCKTLPKKYLFLEQKKRKISNDIYFTESKEMLLAEGIVLQDNSSEEIFSRFLFEFKDMFR